MRAQLIAIQVHEVRLCCLLKRKNIAMFYQMYILVVGRKYKAGALYFCN